MASKKLIVGCDLFLDLKLYKVPPPYLENLLENFPFVEIHEVNTHSKFSIDPTSIEIYWGNRITAQIISELSSLRWIHFGSAGVNRARTQEVMDRQIMVTSSKGTMTSAVAMTALGFMVILARGFHHCAKLQLQNNLNRKTFDNFFEEIHDMESQKCLIVGLGEVGKKLAKICIAAGMQVIAIKKDRAYSLEGIERLYGLEELEKAVRDVDYVVNLLPLTTSTRQIFNLAIFSNMKKSAFFINVGRGETVNEKDLIEALTGGEIAGAGLDVFEKEPLSKSSKLWNLSNVVITPHIAGLSNQYWEREYALFRENLRRYIHSEPLINIVDLKRGY